MSSAIRSTLRPLAPGPYELAPIGLKVSMAETRALRDARGKSGWKAWRRAKVKGLGNSLLKVLANIYSRQSLVPDVPVIPNHHFPFIAEIEANWPAIRAELDVLLKDREAIPFM